MVKINELKQKRIESKKALAALLAKQGASKSKVSEALTAQMKAGSLAKDESKAELDKLRGEAAALDAEVAASNELLQSVEEQIHAEEQRLALEDGKLAKEPSIQVGQDNREDRPWESFGEQLLAVVDAGKAGASIDPRLFATAASGVSTGVASDGGFLVQTDYSTKLMEKASEAAQLLPLCDGFTASEDADSIEAPYLDETSRATGSRWGGIRVYRRAEAKTVADSKPSVAKFELRLEDMMGIAYLTGRSKRDARMMEQIVEKAFESEFAFAFDNEILRGNGVGQMTGIISHAATTEIAIEAGQNLANGAVLTKNISKMWVAMPGRLKAGSVWIHNGELGPALDELSIPSGTAALEPRFVNYGPDGLMRIKGRPVVEVEQCSQPGTVGDFMLVNLAEYAILTKGGLKKDVSMHVRFLYDEDAIRFMVAINGKPKWRTTVTPFKGSTPRAPFVQLAARA